MILEMKPSDPYNFDHSRDTGIEVAKMVKRMGLEKQVVLSSFDPFKLYHARKEVRELNTCFLIGKDYWNDKAYVSTSKTNLSRLDDLQGCVNKTSNSDYARFVLETSAIVKAIAASSLDMDYDIYNNPKYSNNTYQMFKKKYSPEFSYGAWTIYKMKFNAKQIDDSEEKIQHLVDNGAQRLYVDDIPRLLKKLGRAVRKNSATLAKQNYIPRFVIVLILLLFNLLD